MRLDIPVYTGTPEHTRLKFRECSTPLYSSEVETLRILLQG
jgi:hypothetical protein